MPLVYGSKIDITTPLASQEVGRLAPYVYIAPKKEFDWSVLLPWNIVIGVAEGLVDFFKSVFINGKFWDALGAGDSQSWQTLGQIGVSFIPVVGPIASGIWQGVNTGVKITKNPNETTSADVGSVALGGFGVFHGVKSGVRNLNFTKDIGNISNTRILQQIDYQNQYGGGLQAAFKSPSFKAYTELGSKDIVTSLETGRINILNRIFNKPERQLNIIKEHSKTSLTDFHEKTLSNLDAGRSFHSIDSLEYKAFTDTRALDYQNHLENLRDIDNLTLKDIKEVGNYFSKTSEISSETISKVHDTIEKLNELYQKSILGAQNIRRTLIQVLIDYISTPEGKGWWESLSYDERMELLKYALLNKLDNTLFSNISRTSIAKLSKKTIGVTNSVLKSITSPTYLAHKLFDSTFAKLFEPIAELGERIKKGIKVTKSLSDSFEKIGGVLVKSDWVLGYRIVESDTTGHMIQIAFKPEETYTKAQPNGKLPVYVKVSDVELLKFSESKSKGRHYLDNFATGKPGRLSKSTDLSKSGLDSGILAMLPILPLQQLKNIISIVRLSEQVKKGDSLFGGFDKYAISFSKGLSGEFEDETTKTLAKIVGGHNRMVRKIARQSLSGKAVGKIIDAQTKSQYRNAIKRSRTGGIRNGVSSVKKIKSLGSKITKL